MTKILIIEDEADIRQNIKDWLELNNFDVYEAENGRKGIIQSRKIIPDIIICDIMMPDINGYDVREIISSDKTLSDIPFIYLTAKGEIDDFRKGMLMGADDYIVKPFKNEDLIRSIQLRLEKRKFNKKPQAKSEINDKILLSNKKGSKLISFDKIKYIESDANYSFIYSDENEKFIKKKSLNKWEEILPEKDFLRIHQSTIINSKFIEKIDNLTARAFFIKLKDVEKPLIVSQRYTKKIKELFKI